MSMDGLTYGFYNAVENSGEYDRVYTAEQMGQLFDGLIGDGVYYGIGQRFQVKASSGLTVTVGTGRAWFNHTWTYNASVGSLTLEEAHPTWSRIDIIMLEVNASTRVNSIKIKKGTAASSPTAPSLSSNQHPLAKITIAANQTTIAQSNITNMVGTSSCPYVTSVVQVTNIDDLKASMESQFNTWLNAENATMTTLMNSLEEEIAQIQGGAGVDLSPIISYDVSVAYSAWSKMSAPTAGTEERRIYDFGFQYRAKITSGLTTVTSDMRPYITWSLSTIDSSGVNVLNEAQCTSGGVYVYADAKPGSSTSPMIALTIECRKAVEGG